VSDPRRGVFGQTLDPTVSRSLIEVYGIIPAELRVGPERFVILNMLRAAGLRVIWELEKTVATWEEHKVIFLRQVKYDAAGNASVTVFPSGDQGSVNIWNYLNAGTSERWAVVSKDWRSKTWPGRHVAQPGSGHIVMAGKGKMTAAGIAAQPGIKARKWTEMRARIVDPGLEKLEADLAEEMKKYVEDFMWLAKGKSKLVGPGGETISERQLS
jgi:hypothetical protein